MTMEVPHMGQVITLSLETPLPIWDDEVGIKCLWLDGTTSPCFYEGLPRYCASGAASHWCLLGGVGGCGQPPSGPPLSQSPIQIFGTREGDAANVLGTCLDLKLENVEEGSRSKILHKDAAHPDGVTLRILMVSICTS